MWVFCCGMRRSGSTVQYQLTAEIVESRGVGRRLGYLRPQQFLQTYEEHQSKDEFLVVKSHAYIEDATELFSSGKAKAIYVYRDIRDVVVSVMVKGNRSFWRVILSGFVDKILEQYSRWSQVEDILISRYETMVTDLKGEALRIADFLDIDLDEFSARQIAEKYSIDRQMKRIRSSDFENHAVQIGQRRSTMYDPISLLHNDHIYSGEAGQWRAALSPFQTGVVEYLAYDWLVGMGYPISQKWVKQRFVGVAYLLNRIVRLSRQQIRDRS
jgi:hypothetical protein